MKRENAVLSRRSFLGKGAAVAAGGSIIAIAASSPQTAKGAENMPNQMLVGDPVDTTSAQTLYNKTLNSFYNTLGTTALNVKEFLASGTDITDAINDAIDFLANAGFGGTILIPPGPIISGNVRYWTTDGGHDLVSGIVIEGVGPTTNILNGTELKLNSSANDFVFRVKAPWQNCSLRRLTINMQNNSNAAGLVLTDHVNGTIQGTNIYFTNVEEVTFYYGKYGIWVDSKETSGVSTNFECIMNRFERVVFLGCETGFSCNSINGGYTFDSCYFNLPTPNGTALNCKWIGNIALDNCLFVGNQTPVANVPPTDGSTILKTFGAYNNICFYNCQDENVQYYYQNSTNDWGDVPIVFENCIIQSSFKYTANGSVIFDSCGINVTEIEVSGQGQGHVKVTDTSTAWVRVYFKGLTRLGWHFNPPVNTRFDEFVNLNSHLIYETNDIGAPVIHPDPLPNTSSQAFQINASRGAVMVPAGAAYVSIYNNLVTADSLIFAQLRTYDSGGVKIREVQCSAQYFQINLTQNTANAVSVGFTIEG